MSKSGDLFAVNELEQVLGCDLATEFIKHRRAIKKPLTDYATKLMARRLREMPDPRGSAEQSIRNGWSDVFVVKVERQSTLRGMDALEQDLRERIDGHRNDRTGKRVDSAEAVPALSFDGWQGQSRPH